MTEVQTESADGVAVITLCAPDRRNALTPAMARELIAAMDAIDADPDVGAAVLQGQDGHFCAGADRSILAAAAEDPASESAYEAIGEVYRAFRRVGRSRVVVVGALRGALVGAGVNLALATDVRVVSRTARFISGFTRIGLHPGGGHLWLLARYGSAETAAACTLLDQELDGERAVQLGLAWEAVDDALVEQRAVELARAAGRDPALSRHVVQSLRSTTETDVPWDAALAAERAPQMWSLRRRSSDERGQARHE